MAVYHGDEPSALSRALESVLAQELSIDAKIRIYLAVDGPISEIVRRTIQSFSPYIHRVLWFKDNRGLGTVLNEIIAVRGREEFFFRMDADDICDRKRFDRQVCYMLDHPEVDILGTDMVERDPVTGDRRIVRFALSSGDARSMIAWRVPVAHPTVCFRARTFDKVPRYPQVQFNEDIAMWFACMKAGLVFDNLHEPLYEFTIGEGFWKRRGIIKAWRECITYTRGIWAIYGFTWRYLFPLVRMFTRIIPAGWQKKLYASPIRSNVLAEKQ